MTTDAFELAARQRRLVRVLSGMRPVFSPGASSARGSLSRRLRAVKRFSGEIKLGRPALENFAEKLQLNFGF